MAVLLGLNERDPGRLAVWVAVVFVSILVRELGHALMGMAFGYRPQVVPWHGRASTFGEGRWMSSTWKSVLISLAGPGANSLRRSRRRRADVRRGSSRAAASRGPRSTSSGSTSAGHLSVLLLPLDGGNAFRSVAKHSRRRMARRSPASSPRHRGRGRHLRRDRRSVVAPLPRCALGTRTSRRSAALARRHRARAAMPRQTRSSRATAPHNRGDSKGAIALGPVLSAKNVETDARRAGIEVYVVALIKEQRWTDVVRTLDRERGIIGGAISVATRRCSERRARRGR